MAEIEWLLLPRAVEVVAGALPSDKRAARAWIYDRGVGGALEAKIGLVPSQLGPDRDAPLFMHSWPELADLDGTWWETGDHRFDGGTFAWLALQVRKGDLDQLLGVSREDEQLVTERVRLPAVGGSNEREFWTAAIADVCIRWGLGDFKPAKQKDVQQALAEFIESKFDQYPSVGSLKERAKIVWQRIKQANDTE